ncbi:SRPBCC family protein [Rathayibacter sp. YIM 133350]|uniref:SRPBCC family protein n=1 Tax=Rathayibacter sp. YIM 133350 TaxID=3131992 RepID=UPI00307E73CA
MSNAVSSQVDVDVPIDVAYNQWTQFESFPHFLGGVREVSQLDDKRTHWKVSILGVTREFDAEIFEQVPDSHIAWRSTDGPFQSGSVEFTPIDAKHTHITLTIQWNPQGFIESAGAALRLDDLQVSADLTQFKAFIEKRSHQTGSWRGEIHEGSPASAPEPEGHLGRLGEDPDLAPPA